jgi:hypothetical protein
VGLALTAAGLVTLTNHVDALGPSEDGRLAGVQFSTADASQNRHREASKSDRAGASVNIAPSAADPAAPADASGSDAGLTQPLDTSTDLSAALLDVPGSVTAATAPGRDSSKPGRHGKPTLPITAAVAAAVATTRNPSAQPATGPVAVIIRQVAAPVQVTVPVKVTTPVQVTVPVKVTTPVQVTVPTPVKVTAPAPAPVKVTVPAPAPVPVKVTAPAPAPVPVKVTAPAPVNYWSMYSAPAPVSYPTSPIQPWSYQPYYCPTPR